MNYPLADFDPIAMFALLIPIIALLIPIVAILVKHQQKMAQIIHGESGQDSRAQMDALRSEVAQLKGLVHQQTIQLDNLLSAGRKGEPSQISARIES